jgi:hypothetical protein
MEVKNSGQETLDAYCGILSNQRRQYLCAHLLQSGEDVYSLDELVERVLERERGQDSAPQLEKHQQRISIELHHRHLPKLADTGLIDYDARTHTVRCQESLIRDDIPELLKQKITTIEESLDNQD